MFCFLSKIWLTNYEIRKDIPLPTHIASTRPPSKGDFASAQILEKQRENSAKFKLLKRSLWNTT